MRLAISGHQNSGKTTLVAALARELSLEVIPEYLGIDISQRPDVTPAGTAQELTKVLNHQSERQRELKEGFVSDRSPIDLAWFWLGMGLAERFPAKAAAFFASAKDEMQDYDALIFPPGPAPFEGRFNFGRRDKVWTMLRNHSGMIGLAYQWLPADKILMIPPEEESPEQRVAWVLKNIVSTKAAS